MTDLHSDKCCNKAAQELIGEYFKSKGLPYVTLSSSEIAKEYPDCVIYQITIRIADKDIAFTIVLTEDFPDDFPDIYVDQSFYDSHYPLPHLNPSKTLCLFNNLSMPNPDNPVGIVEEAINRAKIILADALAGDKLESEYSEEINHYWANASKRKIISLVSPSNEPKQIYITRAEKPFAADSIKDIYNWFSNLELKTENLDIRSAVYAPIVNYGIPPFPDDNKSWLKILEKNGNDFIKNMTKVASSVDWPMLVIFSTKDSNFQAWAAVEFKEAKELVPLPNKTSRRKKQGVNGFRTGKVPFFHLLRMNPRTLVTRLSVTPIHPNRLFLRGGVGTQVQYNKSVLLVGCGSIGSHIAEHLTKSGLQALSLIDPDTLSFDNIARHVCGGNRVGENKAKALASDLGLKLPHVKFTVKEKSISSVLNNELKWANKHDIIIGALGWYPAELRLNRSRLYKEITTPIVFTWVEPFLDAGHAIYLAPNAEGCFECLFDAEYRFKYRVLDDADYSKREAGCGSSYIPYGYSNIQMFVSNLSQFLLEVVQTPPDHNIVWSWVGDVGKALKEMRPIRPEWKGVAGFKVYRNEFSISRSCVCRNYF